MRDPQRQAVLLLGGDKAGDNRFYGSMIPKVEAIWVQYLRDIEASARAQHGSRNED